MLASDAFGWSRRPSGFRAPGRPPRVAAARRHSRSGGLAGRGLAACGTRTTRLPDRDGGERKFSSYFGLADLLVAKQVLQLAADYVAEHEAEVKSRVLSASMKLCRNPRKTAPSLMGMDSASNSGVANKTRRTRWWFSVTRPAAGLSHSQILLYVLRSHIATRHCA